jgi:hypothetical protein
MSYDRDPIVVNLISHIVQRYNICQETRGYNRVEFSFCVFPGRTLYYLTSRCLTTKETTTPKTYRLQFYSTRHDPTSRSTINTPCHVPPSCLRPRQLIERELTNNLRTFRRQILQPPHQNRQRRSTIQLGSMLQVYKHVLVATPDEDEINDNP